MKYFIILTAFVMLTSCDSSRVYEDFNDLEEAFWHLDSIQTFDFKIEDTTKSYNLLGTFRNASSYPFYNLYFQYTLQDSTGGILLQELKQVDLFNPKTGEPNGSGLGDLFDHSIMLIENHNLKVKGNTHFLWSSSCAETHYHLFYQLERESNSPNDLGPFFIF